MEIKKDPRRTYILFGEKGKWPSFWGKGVGKTTFINYWQTLEHPNTGSIKKFGISLSDADFFIPPNKRNIGVVFKKIHFFPPQYF